jgi:hypothetical protein
MGYMCKRIRCLGILSYKCTIVRAVNGSWRILSSGLRERDGIELNPGGTATHDSPPCPDSGKI